MLVTVSVKRALLPFDAAQNPRGMFDFVNNSYWFRNETYTASQAISDPGQITANGLEVDGTTDFPNAPSILPESLQDFLDEAQFSAVIHFSATSGNVLLELNEWFSGDHITLWWFTEAELTDANNHDGSRSAKDSDNGLLAGTHKIAFTRVNSKVAVAIDGNPVGDDGSFENLFVTMPDPRDTQSDDEGATTFPMIGFNNYHLGGVYSDGFNSPGEPNGACVIKSITFYEPVTDTQLTTLSAL